MRTGEGGDGRHVEGTSGEWGGGRRSSEERRKKVEEHGGNSEERSEMRSDDRTGEDQSWCVCQSDPSLILFGGEVV